MTTYFPRLGATQMKYTSKRKKNQAIENVLALLRKRLPAHVVEPAMHFTQAYYAWVAPEDMIDIPVEDLYGAVLAHWRLAHQRKPHTPTVRVYNPAYEEHGWQCAHTVVEIVTDDMPFLVDSINMELIRHGLTVHLIIHPVMHIRRDRKGRLIDLVAGEVEAGDIVDEALLHFEVDQQTDRKVLLSLGKDIQRILRDVRAVVMDWEPMRNRLTEIIATLESLALPMPSEETAEDLEFLRWLGNHHFTFIGFRTFDLEVENGKDVLRLVPNSSLGIFRERESQKVVQIPARLRELARKPALLILTKSTIRSTVHRPVQLDYLGIKRFNDAGQVIGEWRFQGLYSSLAYDTRPAEIPLLRRKVAKVLQHAALAPSSHAGKAMQHILDNYPRDEMFQASDDELLEIITGILNLQERQLLRVFVRRDLYGRFVSALVFAPRDRYSTELRRRMQEILIEAFAGLSSEFDTQFTSSVLARAHFVIRTDPEHVVDIDTSELESRMLEAMLSWEDRLQLTLQEQFGEAEGNRLNNRYSDAFPAAYRDDYTARTAAMDIKHLETIHDYKSLAMHLYSPPEAGDTLLRFKVYGRHHPMALSDVLPILERMGLRVLTARPYSIEPHEATPYWILNFDMTPARETDLDVLGVKDIFQDAFARVCHGDMENDGFNGLVLLAGLEWRQVMLLRAICKYLLQTQIPFSQAYMEQTLSAHPEIVRTLVALFYLRFDPHTKKRTDEASTRRLAEIEEAIEGVASLDEDRILRHFLSVILATMRTNYFQADKHGELKSYLCLKLDSSQVPDLPAPIPRFEVFVYATHVEGIHLRGGLVARGGLRWSDRREDFRTEVLGLLKAQMVKNAVIVPVGAKGGFVPKQLPTTGGRNEIQQEVIRCYKTFIRGLLDITDNRLGDQLQAPRDVVRYDADDPYLVVAADKGTATFSDIANEIAMDYGFWLGDAFASGGTHGYDHKKMGITARGAWESVKRHFRELGLNTQEDTFTAIGIGDMSGDVFGNGMLRSPHIRLLAAFNHIHIFVDPNPDTERSFLERERLFKSLRSSWSDYDAKQLSAGGGIFSRSAKSIALSEEARKVLGIRAERLTPNALIQAVLRAPVDLLWNGGIGTYVKASSESHADAGDRTNDAVRIDAGELRCRVIGEGGNLGLTQRARVEFALKGGLIYTDAIDNSGGVDCSDHEVNIKILLNRIVANGDMTAKQRNQLLSQMTDEVARLVLRHNYLQTQAISIAANQANYLLHDHRRLINTLEQEGRLERELEDLPTDEILEEREAAETGLTRPEIAVLLAYSKIKLYEDLLRSGISEDEYLSRDLHHYFPGRLREQFASELSAHSLRRDITVTHITNSMINRMGSTFHVTMEQDMDATPADVARAYATGREIFQVRKLWRAIEDLDNKVSAETQIQMMGETRRLLARTTRWLLSNRRGSLDISALVDQFAPRAEHIQASLPSLLRGSVLDKMKSRVEMLHTASVPADLAQRIAALDALFLALDIIEVANQTETDLTQTTETYFELSVILDLHWLHERIRELPRFNHWQRTARSLLRDELRAALRSLTQQVVMHTKDMPPTVKRIDTWLKNNSHQIEHYQHVFDELKTATKFDMAIITVAVQEVRNLARIESPPCDAPAGEIAKIEEVSPKTTEQQTAYRTT